MTRHLWIRTAQIAALGAAYLLVSEVISRLTPFPWMEWPDWWMPLWSSRAVGLYVWWLLFHSVFAVASALPVAMLLIWKIPKPRIAAALAVGLLVAMGMLIDGLVEYPPWSMPRGSLTRLYWSDGISQFIVTVLAVPLWVWVAGVLLSNYRIERSLRE